MTSSDSDHHDLSTAVLRLLSHPQLTALTAEVEAIFSHIFQSQQLTAPHPKSEPQHIPFYNDITGCDLRQPQSVKSAAMAPEFQWESQIRILTSTFTPLWQHTKKKKSTFQKWRTDMQPWTVQHNMPSSLYIRTESKSDSWAILKILNSEFLCLNLQPAMSSTCYQVFCQNPLLLEAKGRGVVIVSPAKD